MIHPTRRPTCSDALLQNCKVLVGHVDALAVES